MLSSIFKTVNILRHIGWCCGSMLKIYLKSKINIEK